MESIEEKAKDYLMNFPTNSTFSIEEMIVNAFVAGSKAKEEEPVWRMGNDLLPLVDGAQYLVKKDKRQHWCEICTWNETYQCWDDEDGDDIKYESVDLYMEIPE